MTTPVRDWGGRKQIRALVWHPHASTGPTGRTTFVFWELNMDLETRFFASFCLVCGHTSDASAVWALQVRCVCVDAVRTRSGQAGAGAAAGQERFACSRDVFNERETAKSALQAGALQACTLYHNTSSEKIVMCGDFVEISYSYKHKGTSEAVGWKKWGECRPLHLPCPNLVSKLFLPTQRIHRNITHSFLLGPRAAHVTHSTFAPFRGVRARSVLLLCLLCLLPAAAPPPKWARSTQCCNGSIFFGSLHCFWHLELPLHHHSRFESHSKQELQVGSCHPGRAKEVVVNAQRAVEPFVGMQAASRGIKMLAMDQPSNPLIGRLWRLGRLRRSRWANW